MLGSIDQELESVQAVQKISAMPDSSSASHYNRVEGKKNLSQEEHATPWSLMSGAQQSYSLSQKPAAGSALSETFLLPEHKRPTVKHDDFTDLEVPVIDLTTILACGDDDADDDGAMESVLSQVRDACLNWGFFQIINHGIEEELLARVQSQAQLFFSLPYEEKVKVSKPAGRFAGYGHATVKDGDVRPWSEGFYFTDVESTAELAQKLWPPGTNNDFVDSYSEYNDKVRRLSGRLMQIVVAGLHGVKNPAHFSQYTRNTGGLLRWNFYPVCPEPLRTLGLTEHTDFNLLTVVHQGHIGGLQILKDGQWIAVRPRPGALAVNLGDTLQVLTNAKYKSVPHRAVVNAAQSRLSLVYFYVPLPSIDIVPAPELVDEQHPCLYKPFNFQSITKMKQMFFLDTLDHFRIH